MKKLFRIIGGAMAFALAASAGPAGAQDYPSKPVRMVVGMAPGGSNDTIARLISAELSKSLGQTVVVENKPGANSTIATSELARATPDGHTLMLVISSHVTNTLLYSNLNYKLTDFTPVSLIADTPFVLVANPKFEPNTMAELIALAKQQKSGIDFGTPGLGSTQHISMELMNQMAGIKMNHIPYKGGAPAQTDLISGVIPLIFATPTQSLPFIKNKQLKAIGVSSSKRLPQLPDVPTLAESGLPGYEADVWFGVIAPAGTPAPVVEKLNKEIRRIVQTPEFRKQLVDMGLNPLDRTPAQFQELIENERTKWAAVIKKSDIKVE